MTQPKKEDGFYRGDTWAEAAYWAGASDLESAEVVETEPVTPVPLPKKKRRRAYPMSPQSRKDAG